jgi:sigma-B regulation protein RsbU (phosphoserine phosphatase)
LALLVADVSGHGLGAALLMAEARAYLRLLARQSSDPSEILIAACKALADDLGEDRFITAGLYCLNPATHQLRYASAGHPPAHVLGADGEIRHVLEWTGPPLKRRTRRPCQNGPVVQLLPGDTLLLITDGIDEAMDAAGKECFGLDRAIDVVRRYRHLSAEEIARRLCQAVRDHGAPEPTYDDLTVVIAKVGDIAESVDSKTYT